MERDANLLAEGAMGRDSLRPDYVRRDSRYWVFFTVFTSVSLTWMVAATWDWLHPVIKVPAMHMAVNASQYGQDLVLSALSLALGLLLVWLRPHDATARWFGVGLIGTAVGFSLIAHHLLLTLDPQAMAPGLSAGAVGHVVFHFVAGGAYAYALLLFPDGRTPRVSPLTNFVLGGALTAILVLAVTGQEPAYFISYCGAIVLVAGCFSQWHKARHGETPQLRRLCRGYLRAFALALGLGAVLVVLERVPPLVGILGTRATDQQMQDGMLGTLTALVLTASPPLLAATGVVVFLGIVSTNPLSPKPHPTKLHSLALRHRERAALMVTVGVTIGFVAVDVVVHKLTEDVADAARFGAYPTLTAAAILGLGLEWPREVLREAGHRAIFGTHTPPKKLFQEFADDLARLMSPDDVVSALGTALDHALQTRALRLVVWWKDSKEYAYTWPPGATGRDDVLRAGHDELSVQREDVSVELWLARAPATRLSSGERRLAIELAGQAGVVIRDMIVRAARKEVDDVRPAR